MVNSKQNTPKYFVIINVIWALFLIIAIALTFTTGTKVKNRLYDIQIEASTLAKNAMDAIKQRKNELGIVCSNEDLYESGLLGPKRTKIQTTEGDPAAKRTSTNPNFASVYIEMFKEAGLKQGDEIAIVMSSSFPALNISVTTAAEVYGLKTCIMSGIGASSYGATDPEFTYFDMAEYLYSSGYLKKRIDYVSFGGGFDDGSEFNKDIYNSIKSRIDASGVGFINEPNFEKNISLRIKLIKEKCPNLKLFVNVGGSLVSMGDGYTKAVNYRGLIKPNYLKLYKNSTPKKNKGLLETFLENGTPIIQMLNITKIAYEYGLPKDPVGIPQVGSGNVYYEIKYNIIFPILALIVSAGILTYYFINRKNNYYLR